MKSQTYFIKIPNGFYIILEGSVLISVKDTSNREQEVVFLSNGDLFGETALLQREVSQVSVTVIDDLKAIAIEPDSVIHIVQEYPKFAMEINSFIQTRKQAIHNAKGVESKLVENGKLHPLLYWGGRVHENSSKGALHSLSKINIVHFFDDTICC